eukprot:2132316-Pyramimonas_sp.AAC.1
MNILSRHVHVLHAVERFLLVKLRAPMLKHSTAVLHAPHHKRGTFDPPAHVRQWWREVRETLDKYPPSIILTGASARMGRGSTSVSGHVGPQDPTDYNGLELQKLANQYDLMITNTFIPRSHPHTFRAKCGALHRLDYVLLHRAVHDCASLCNVMNDLDFATKSPDHWPLIVSIAAAKLYVAPEPGRPKLDRHGLADPVKQEKFQRMLKNLPVATWDTDINCQVEDFNDVVVQGARELFAGDRFSPRKPCIKT